LHGRADVLPGRRQLHAPGRGPGGVSAGAAGRRVKAPASCRGSRLSGARGLTRILAACAAALLLLALAPRFLERGALNDSWNLAFAVGLASSWNMLGGFAGQVSIGYSAFLGIGAYTTALLSLAGWEPYVTVPVGAALAAAFSVVIGLPAFRLRGPYFTIATIGVSEAVRVFAAGVQFTGGSSGLRMPAGSFDFGRNYLAMTALAVCV